MNDVELVAYQSSWKIDFQWESEAIEEAVRPVFRQCHHIGSTAIVGICAKPVVDMILEVTSVSKLDDFNATLEDLGYVARGEFGIADRRFFHKGTPRTHHIHAFEVGHPQVSRHIRFRDYLNAVPEKAEAYERLKQELAREFRDDRTAYSAGKSDFISQLDTEAAAFFAG